jgi:hypothetical protein
MNNLSSKTIFKSLLIILSLGIQYSYGFDVEDYHTTYRGTRDALVHGKKNLRLAELSLIGLIKANPKLPMRISTFSKMGTEIGCCCYQKNCAVINTKANQLALFDKTVSNGKKLKNFEYLASENSYGQEGYSADLIKRLRNEIEDYHDRLDPNILASQQTLLEDQPSSSLYDEEIRQSVENMGFSSPFGSSAAEKMAQFRDYKDTYLRSLQEVKMGNPAYLAAKAAFAEAVRHYYNNSNCAGFNEFTMSFDDFVLNVGGKQ